MSSTPPKVPVASEEGIPQQPSSVWVSATRTNNPHRLDTKDGSKPTVSDVIDSPTCQQLAPRAPRAPTEAQPEALEALVHRRLERIPSRRLPIRMSASLPSQMSVSTRSTLTPLGGD